MELESIQIRNFRSLWSDDNSPSIALELCDRVNFIVGPNNCGKSNILRALALALQDREAQRFNKDLDVPSHIRFTVPTITLQFRFTSNSSPEATLRTRAIEYEKSVHGSKKTFAENGILRYTVQYRTSAASAASRIEGIQAGGTGALRGDADKLRRVLDQFHRVVRFIYIKSGEDLTSALAGGLTEILGTVLQEHLAAQMSEANTKRSEYIKHLSTNLLQPLSEHLNSELGDICSEITETEFAPYVPTIEETLSQATINLADPCISPLADKGTGVRGALLVALMAYIARESKRTVIFALEEPESFLHPSAQEGLLDDLNALSKRSGVSLLVTTHSPFLLSRKGEGKVSVLCKDGTGRTQLAHTVTNGDVRIQALAPLFSNLIVPNLLDRIASVKQEAKFIIVVEGYTDKQYLVMAAEKCNRLDLIDDVEIVYAEGADMAGHQALTLKYMFGKEKPVLLLLDYDESGKSIEKMLTGKFKFQKRRDVETYAKWIKDGNKDVEAEDLFPESLMNKFIKKSGEGALAEKVRRDTSGWHYGLTQAGKGAFLPFLESHSAPADFEKWIKVLEDIRKIPGIAAAIGASKNGAVNRKASTP